MKGGDRERKKENTAEDFNVVTPSSAGQDKTKSSQSWSKLALPF